MRALAFAPLAVLVLCGCATASSSNVIRPAAGAEFHASVRAGSMHAAPVQVVPVQPAPGAGSVARLAPPARMPAHSQAAPPTVRTITAAGTTQPAPTAPEAATLETPSQPGGQPACPTNPGSGLPCVVR